MNSSTTGLVEVEEYGGGVMRVTQFAVTVNG